MCEFFLVKILKKVTKFYKKRKIYPQFYALQIMMCDFLAGITRTLETNKHTDGVAFWWSGWKNNIRDGTFPGE